MYRYLLHFSYIGTNFHGIQKTVNKLDRARIDISTVQGCIEMALNEFQPANEIQTVLSSRTDTGVHALHSTLHVDLQRQDCVPFNANTITIVLNRKFYKEHLPIRVLKTELVPESFHCRFNARGRSYLYRLAIAKPQEHIKYSKKLDYVTFMPIEELDRCYFVQNPKFNVENCRSAANLFLGKHDFRTFMSTSKQAGAISEHPMYSVRRIDEISITPGFSLALEQSAQRANQLYDYWNIEIKAKSFLYKQVRRIVATLLAAASGRIDEKRIYTMLTVPSKNSWETGITLAPAHGLYLKQVHYDPSDLKQ